MFFLPQEEEAEERIQRQLYAAIGLLHLCLFLRLWHISLRYITNKVIFTVCTLDPCIPNCHLPVLGSSTTCADVTGLL